MPVSQLTVMNDQEKSGLPHAAPRLMQILRVLARHKFLGTLRGKEALAAAERGAGNL